MAAEQAAPSISVSSTLDAIQVLEDIDRQIRETERKLNQQRIDTAVLAVELSTLHDPLMRETMALCYQGHAPVGKEIETYVSATQQTLQDFQPVTQERAQHMSCEVQDISSQAPQPPMPTSSRDSLDQNNVHFPCEIPQNMCPGTSGSG